MGAARHSETARRLKARQSSSAVADLAASSNTAWIARHIPSGLRLRAVGSVHIVGDVHVAWSMIFSENRLPPADQVRRGFFGIML
jgi:hypothetical protein